MNRDSHHLLDALDRIVNRKDPGEVDAGLSEIAEPLLLVRGALESMNAGELNMDIGGRGYLIGLVKQLQASLRHLTWQTKAVASGDFSQTVDFLGDFSDAFNTMTRRLEETMTELKFAEETALETSRKLEQTNRELMHSEQRHRLLADNATDVIWTMDLSGRLTYVSPSVTRLRGFSVEEVLSQTPEQLLAGDSLKVFLGGMAQVKRAVEAGRPFPTFRGELDQPCKDGSVVKTEATVTGIYDETQTFIGVLGISRDITEQKRLQDEVRKLSVTDRLTGLANRLKLDETLEGELCRSKRSGAVFSVILIDLDHFKDINDTLGHQAGDEVLVEVAGIFQTNTRQVDLAGRWGGEEFLVISPDTDRKGVRVLAERIRVALETHPFSCGAQITASFGTASWKTQDTLSSLISRADRGLYLAKRTGRNRVEESTDNG